MRPFLLFSATACIAALTVGCGKKSGDSSQRSFALDTVERLMKAPAPAPAKK